MARIILIGVLTLIIVITGASLVSVGSKVEQSGLALIATGMREPELKSFIREYYRDHVVVDAGTTLTDDAPVTLTYVSIDTNATKDIIATVESNATCGSGGCLTTIFLTDDLKEPQAIDFSYAARSIEVLESVTNGMHDIEINGSKLNRMTWDGARYVPLSY